MWCDIIGKQFIVSHVLTGRLTREMCWNFLEYELPIFLEDVPLPIRVAMYMQQDGAPTHSHRIVCIFIEHIQTAVAVVGDT